MKYKKWYLIGIALLCIGISVYIGSFVVEKARDPQAFSEWIASYGMFAQLLMFLFVFLQVVFAWLPGEVFEVVAGYAFGFWQGSFLVLLASLCASTCIMLLVRRYGQRIVSIFFPKQKLSEIPFLHDSSRLSKGIAMAFLIPGSPKDLLTYAIGLSDMKVSHFLCISTFARIPSVVTSTLTGSALGNENYSLALYSFLFTIVISALGMLVYRSISQLKHKAMEGNIQK